MELIPKRRLQLFAGRSNLPLAEKVAAHLDVKLGEANIVDFASGEIACRFGESVRGSDVFIVQTHCRPVNDMIMEQLIMIDAAKRASAKRITAVCPFYGYGRQDRKAEGREPITAKLLADMMTTAGANRMVSVDLHSGQIQGFFDVPVDHLFAMPVLVRYVQDHVDGDLVIVSPDAGRTKVAERFSQYLNADMAFVHKRHIKGVANAVEAREVVGDVDGRTCVIIDDMIDTAGTICAAAEIVKKRGALDVIALATHGVLSDPSLERLQRSVLSRVVVTDTLPLPEDPIDKIQVLSVAEIIAAAIDAVFEDTSVSDIFDGEKHL